MQATSNNGIVFHAVPAAASRHRHNDAAGDNGVAFQTVPAVSGYRHNDAWPRTFANSSELVDCIAADRSLFMCVMMAISDTIQSRPPAKKRRLDDTCDLPTDETFGAVGPGPTAMEIGKDDYMSSFASSSTPCSERPPVEASKDKQKTKSKTDEGQIPKAKKPRAKCAKKTKSSTSTDTATPPEAGLDSMDTDPVTIVDEPILPPPLEVVPAPIAPAVEAEVEAQPPKKSAKKPSKKAKMSADEASSDPTETAPLPLPPPQKPRKKAPKQPKAPTFDEPAPAKAPTFDEPAPANADDKIGKAVISEEKPRKQKGKKAARIPTEAETAAVVADADNYTYLDESGDVVDPSIATHRVDAGGHVYDINTGSRMGRHMNGVIVPSM